jgi:hypothetical protein
MNLPGLIEVWHFTKKSSTLLADFLAPQIAKKVHLSIFHGSFTLIGS